MKKFFFLLSAILGFMLTSCSTVSDVPSNPGNETLILKSDLSMHDFMNVCQSISFDKESRGTIDEQQAAVLLEPLVIDGENLRNQIVSQVSLEDSEFFEKLSEEELAALSFVIHSLDEISIREEQESTQSIDFGRFASCFGVATGYSLVKDLSVTGLINARTVKQLLLCFAKRYVGYIGLVVVVYEFYNCYN